MKIVFLDAYNLIYRARSGFTKGDYHVVYNFFRHLRPLIEKFDPDKVYFVLEGQPKFRQQITSGEYKGNRKSPREESFLAGKNKEKKESGRRGRRAARTFYFNFF